MYVFTPVLEVHNRPVRTLFAGEGPSLALKGQIQGYPLGCLRCKSFGGPLYEKKKYSNVLASVASAKILGFSMKMPLKLTKIAPNFFRN